MYYYYAKLGTGCIRCYLPSHFYHLVAEKKNRFQDKLCLSVHQQHTKN